jgi:hypothetical protein
MDNESVKFGEKYVWSKMFSYRSMHTVGLKHPKNVPYTFKQVGYVLVISPILKRKRSKRNA